MGRHSAGDTANNVDPNAHILRRVGEGVATVGRHTVEHLGRLASRRHVREIPTPIQLSVPEDTLVRRALAQKPLKFDLFRKFRDQTPHFDFFSMGHKKSEATGIDEPTVEIRRADLAGIDESTVVMRRPETVDMTGVDDPTVVIPLPVRPVIREPAADEREPALATVTPITADPNKTNRVAGVHGELHAAMGGDVPGGPTSILDAIYRSHNQAPSGQDFFAPKVAPDTAANG
jgi:hypothetical protein